MSAPRPRSHLSFHFAFTTKAAMSSEMSSASMSRNDSIHFCRFADRTGRIEVALGDDERDERTGDRGDERRAGRDQAQEGGIQLTAPAIPVAFLVTVLQTALPASIALLPPHVLAVAIVDQRTCRAFLARPTARRSGA